MIIPIKPVEASPAWYPLGMSFMSVNEAVSGWPARYGLVTTTRIGPFRTAQTLVEKGSARTWVRAEGNSVDRWGDWVEITPGGSAVVAGVEQVQVEHSDSSDVAQEVQAFAMTTATVSTSRRQPYQHPFDARDYFNVPISTLARYETSDRPKTKAFISRPSSATVNHRNGWSVECVWGKSTDPLVTIRNPTNSSITPLKVHIPASYRPPAGSDGLTPDGATALYQDSGVAYDLYKPKWTGSTTMTSTRWVKQDWRGFGTSRGVRAAGVSYAEGLMRDWEIDAAAAGAIKSFAKVLALSIPGSVLDPYPTSEDGVVTYDTVEGAQKAVAVEPANTRDRQVSGSTYTGNVAMGAHFAIPHTVDIEAVFASKGIKAPAARAFGRTLRNFGAVVTDRSASWALYAEPSADPARVAEIVAAWKILMPYMRRVLNTSLASPGGAPLSSTAPRLHPMAGGF